MLYEVITNFIMYLIFSLVFLIYKKRKYQNESGFHLKASLLLEIGLEPVAALETINRKLNPVSIL